MWSAALGPGEAIIKYMTTYDMSSVQNLKSFEFQNIHTKKFWMWALCTTVSLPILLLNDHPGVWLSCSSCFE